MRHLLFRPPMFLLAGFFWLFLSSILGLALFLGIVTGRPLPPVLRLIHVHSALVGGVAQMILGAMLAFIPPLLMTGRTRPEAHPVLFTLINLGTIVILIGFGLHDYTFVGIAGGVILVAFLTLFLDAVRQSRSSLVSPPLNLWFYGVALVALLAGLGMGEGIALRLFPSTFVGQGRLAHIHLNLLGFVTLTIIGTMHNLFPTVLNTRLHSARLAQWTFFLLPTGIAVLVLGFLTGSTWIQIGGGTVVLSAVVLYGINIFKTWTAAGRPGGIVSDHFLLATLFLLLVVPVGILVSVNSLWDPPAVPFGTLHLVAYSHLALVGFIVQTIIGALSHLLPIGLALNRVPSNKKRGPYLAHLTRIAERWRITQVSAVTFGTLGLAIVAALVWQFNLGSVTVQVAGWISAALLLLGLGLFGAKVALLIAEPPPA
ncbi:hypothetical protein [Candidatus Nitrospira bockiana]